MQNNSRDEESIVSKVQIRSQLPHPDLGPLSRLIEAIWAFAERIGIGAIIVLLFLQPVVMLLWLLGFINFTFLLKSGYWQTVSIIIFWLILTSLYIYERGRTSVADREPDPERLGLMIKEIQREWSTDFPNLFFDLKTDLNFYKVELEGLSGKDRDEISHKREEAASCMGSTLQHVCDEVVLQRDTGLSILSDVLGAQGTNKEGVYAAHIFIDESIYDQLDAIATVLDQASQLAFSLSTSYESNVH